MHPLLETWPATRHVPWLGIEPATLWITGWHSIHWATPARVVMCNFFVNLTGLQGARILGQTLLWVCLWGVLDEINIWMGRLSKADCPLLCGCLISNPLKTWIEHKTWSSLKQEGTSIAWLYEVRHWSFRPFGLQLKKTHLLQARSQQLLNWKDTIDSPVSAPCRLQKLGLFNLHNHVIQFL